MLIRAGTGIVLIVAILGVVRPGLGACGPSPEKSWVEFVDKAHGFCFWHPPTYRKEPITPSRHRAKDRQILATLISGEPRKANSDDKEPAALRIYLFSDLFDLQMLVRDAPTGYDTPPAPARYGVNVFYHYGAGGGGVAYPDSYYFNLHGRVLELEFDGPYPGNDKSPNAQTQAVEKVILSSFKAPRR